LALGFSFFALPKKRKKKTLGKNQPTYPQPQPFPRDFAGPARSLAKNTSKDPQLLVLLDFKNFL
jgi:hypothetical protein